MRVYFIPETRTGFFRPAESPPREEGHIRVSDSVLDAYFVVSSLSGADR
jgi:hypothetical protein